MGIKNWIIEKLNPAQHHIAREEGDTKPGAPTITSKFAYRNIEVVNRGTNLIADTASTIKYDIGDKINTVGVVNGIRAKKLDRLINYAPNPFISVDAFNRNVYMDLIIDGNAFIYFDGAHMYNLPANMVVIHTDPKTFVSKYEYANTDFHPDEIIHIRDNAADSIYRGTSRLNAARNSIEILNNMNNFQSNFFANHAIPGLILKSENTLSRKIKERMLEDWVSKYSAKRGGRLPMILDGGLSVDKLGNTDFKSLDFVESIKIQEIKILKALGVPPILLDSGNNANLGVNLKNFYLTTIIPLHEKVLSAYERYFGFDLKSIKQDIMALRPELDDEGSYLSTLVNAGIITRNEARQTIRKPKIDTEEADSLIIPANIAGSAVNPTVGGAPENSDRNED